MNITSFTIKSASASLGALHGASRVIDLFSYLEDRSVVFRSDADALREDWETVGSDLQQAIQQYAK